MMNKAILLTKASLKNAWQRRGRKGRTRALGTPLTLVLLTLLFASYATLYALLMAEGLEALGMLELLLPIGFLLAALVSLFFSIYKVPSYLFTFQDYEMLAAMPVKNSDILMSKLIYSYGSNLGTCCEIILPFLIVFGVKSGQGLLFYLRALLTVLALPLFPMVVGAVIGLLLHWVASRFRARNAVLMVLSLAMFFGIFYFSFSMSSMGEDQMLSALTGMARFLSTFPPAVLFVEAMLGSWLSLLGLTGLCLLVFLLFVLVFSRSFVRINSVLREKHSRANFRMGALKSSSQRKALFTRELRRYFSEYTYVMNTAVGMLLLTVLTILFAVSGKGVLSSLLEMNVSTSDLMPIFCAICTLMCGMTCTTGVSISLEGKTLWILRSLPVRETDIFRAKIFLNLLVTLPLLTLNVAALGVLLSLNPLEFFILWAVPAVYSVFTALFGLFVNLLLPKMEWNSAMVVIKQSASSFASVFGGMLAVIAVALVYLFLLPQMDFLLFGGIAAAVFALIDLVLWARLRSWGVKKLRTL